MSKTELLFCKSSVYLHPTTSKRDNVCGFVSLTRDPGASPTEIHLNFTPKGSLSSDEAAIYNEVDVVCQPGMQAAKKTYEVTRPSLGGYATSWALSFVYSLQFRPPKVGLWYGSVVVNTKDGNRTIFFFHDDESASTKAAEKQRNQAFDPFAGGGLYWGGVDLKEALASYINLAQSVEKSVWLVNPDSADLRNFAPFIEKPAKKEASVVPEMPKLGQMFNQAKWRVLETIATLGARTKNNVLDLYDEHAPTPIKQLIRPEMIGEFNDTTSVYLAKWAQQVKEEAEQNQMVLTSDMYRAIEKELGGELLTDEEVARTSRRAPISEQEWASMFDSHGRLQVPEDEAKDRIFHGGLDPAVRPEAWLFLLGVYPWTSDRDERASLRASYESGYHDYKRKWVEDDAKRHTEFWRDQKHRIEKDVNRNDRQLELFKRRKRKNKVGLSNVDSSNNNEGYSSNPNVDSSNPNNSEYPSSNPNNVDYSQGMGSSGSGSGIVGQTQSVTRESSPETPDDDDDEFDEANIANPHLYAMREILLTFNEYNENLGYVQGMTDLLSPLYVTIRDESLTFWAFAKFMERMERNFLRDVSGMKRQMSTLTQLLQFMLPKLHAHLEKCESADLFFFFRMLLVWFKRELQWDQIGPLWEVLWTDYYSSQYHLFVALAILSDNERIILQNLNRFDEVLKYMNELSGHLNMRPILVRAELLFLKFRRMVDIIDRENSLKLMNASPYQREQGVETTEISPDLRLLLSHEPVIEKEGPRPEGALGG
ncbi:GTPase-activating protein Gyp7p [Diutina catenulata]